ncbi:hypothetical protein TVAG_223960 [Trichomonas vaginalis G3]|uniref:Nascent polypeptide-associated complex subunit alpha-like UBA domain-containing protein n=1 Tax=Trichomonas vaginalis (strain ATCC PRA-98 / G3) TaxID=412133 RepID=A2DW19_TRIV3|nr:hypothetical protein TVAGG3_0805280 [Trichomonas vaginalis G3]EAY15320.1 hypothetical protein TVAG_223960 [Trichomonas vaginalis G3]KAI5496817.1 hypothetical protein TVAGG3_0805280 [Trichomonas vaginalis G3]|eukprot:XP_001327543.1 hypothetical protein [Trichomonas vaginalis G3]
MTKQAPKSSLKPAEEASVGNMGDINKLNEEKKDQKPALVIEASNLNLVMKYTGLDKQSAIDLIEKNNGDIKASLKSFVLE